MVSVILIVTGEHLPFIYNIITIVDNHMLTHLVSVCKQPSCEPNVRVCHTS